jgi:hypothetical protein
VRRHSHLHYVCDREGRQIDLKLGSVLSAGTTEGNSYATCVVK